MVEFAGIIVLGIFAQWLAWRYKVPAILPLILIGLGVGPISTLYTEDGLKLIEPIFDIKTGHGLFPGQSLFYFVSLSIGIILFEGGLTLKKKEIEGVGASIVRLITMGSAVTFVGAGLAAHYIMNLNWDISFLFAGLIIVTGPTVIAPILQNIPLNRNVATVLKWEGILIDPIGALVAVLVFEFIVSSHGGLEMT
ncbi:MAG TPA: cell shape-determining protein, partial [Saprospiraceae bacterium]|nr:cell shape-determining protein [Saprospiraceae bacterium]